MKIVDSHCHLHMINNDLLSVLQNARNNGVGYFLNVATQWSENDIINDIINLNDNIWRSVGIHPSYSKKEKNITTQHIINYIDQNSKVIAIGECGFDFYHASNPSEKIQQDMFLKQIYAAQETQLPLIIHTRNADKHTINILKQEMMVKKFKFIIHCFAGSKYLAEESLALDGYISISGIITFKNNLLLQEIIKNIVPLNKLLIETDCPYLTPQPFQGRFNNEPMYIIHTVKALSEILLLDEFEFINITYNNFFHLFKNIEL